MIKEIQVTGETSDGYHTFNELYEFRKVYNATLFNEWAAQGKYGVHKSMKHHDGELCFGGGWFIVVAVLPSGQISNHYEMSDWGLFDVPSFDKAQYEFDGHTAHDVVVRLQSLSPKEMNPVMRVELKQDGVSFEKFSLLPESSNPIATDHTTIQPTQTEAPKEGKEEVRKFVYLIEDTHPSRQGMWWGLEEVPLTSWETTFKAWTNDPLKAIQFATFEKADEQRKELNMYGYIVTEHDFVEMPPHEKVDSKPSLEPNQTEAEKESKEQVLKKHFIKAMVDDGTPSDEADEIYFAAHIGDKGQFRVHNVVLNAMEEYASLARKQVIEEIEEWVKKEWFGAKEDDMTYYEHVVNADELLTKLQELCKK